MQIYRFVFVKFKFLFFTGGGRPLSWEIRIKVAIQTARGLSFLHGSKPQIIFRDFKASNILLDTVCSITKITLHYCGGLSSHPLWAFQL